MRFLDGLDGGQAGGSEACGCGHTCARDLWSHCLLEPRLLEVEVALDPVHHRVVDPPDPAQLHDRPPLGLEELAAQPLVVERLALDLAVVSVVEAGGKTAAAEAVEAAQTLGRLGSNPLL